MSDSDGNNQTPYFFFIALGMAIVFTNLWVILGIRYCRRNRTTRSIDEEEVQYSLTPFGPPLTLRPRERRVLSREDLERRFPAKTLLSVHEVAIEEEEEEHAAVKERVVQLNVSEPNLNYHEESKVKERVIVNVSEPNLHLHEYYNAPQRGAKTMPNSTVNLNNSDTVSLPIPTINNNDNNATNTDNEDNTIACSICLDAIEPANLIRQLDCHHVFHDDCIARWLTTRKAVCPLCQTDFYEPPHPPAPHRTETDGDEPHEPQTLRARVRTAFIGVFRAPPHTQLPVYPAQAALASTSFRRVW
ncbi:hypothetical protein TRVA0_014S02058 [Trichomonascus vanleenenianus]|uniref:RING finger protein n=1 Tax=Trichomonascus vanleenenianus TaxID=2268995 RepID=UPI003ECAA5B2